MKKCDVIIPIYNAYDCLAPCIESVIKNTNLEENRLILIDDKSPDERVLPLLEKYANRENIILLKNNENLGFVQTVNKGMKFSKENDVLLLNSDTEVTNNWLDKIKECAYKTDNIATVTPLSNNATLTSVPKHFEPNDLPKNYSLEQMASLVEKSSYGELIEVPTGHGFCLYIRRDALDIVGYFDAETYGKGYGEENDFCFRCIDAGLINVICDNTYILHKESQSFQVEKEELIKQGMKEIQKKFPEYKDRLDLWCSKKEISYLGQNISFNIGNTENRPNVLFVIHDWKDVRNNLGGTTLHAWDIVRNLKDKFNFHVLTSEDGNFKVYSYWDNNQETVVKFPGVEQFSMLSFNNFEYRKMVKKIIEDFNINIVHVHHLINHYFDLFEVAKEKNIYTIMTLHDYYTICPRINKLYNNVQYCENGEIKKCQTCLLDNFKSTERSLSGIKAWRKKWYDSLKRIDLLLTPSEASKKEILKTYPDLDIKVIEHGVDIQKEESNLTLDDDTLNIAFVGAIGIHKGSNILSELVKTKKLKNTKVHLFGICNYKLTNNNHFIDHGKYKREELKELLKDNNIKVICLLSTWPETFSYTMTESIACGIPVLAFDFGAIAERIKKYGLGWVIPYNAEFDEILNKLQAISENKKEYNKIIKNINDYKYKETKEMANEYGKIYSKHLSGDGKINTENIKELFRLSVKQYATVSFTSYEWVFDTLKWKIISKFKIPKPIKKIIRKCRNND